jgi:hypothetical protein
MKNATIGLSAILGCVLFLSGCSALKTGAQYEDQARVDVSLQDAVALGIAALREYRDIDDWAGRYELQVRRHEDHWTLRFLYLPASPGGETSVLVYDTRKVLIIGGM